MPNLPQEVLADILSDAVPKPPCHDYAEWWERQRSLASFALVHTSWTSIAQALLFAECRILSRDHEILRKAAAGLVLTSGRVKTQWLTVTGDLIALLEVTGFERWKDVTYLVHAGDNTFLTPPERYGKFPQLETLILEHGDFLIRELDPPVTFPHLRRLVLACSTLINGCISACQMVFSPAYMPHLSHLSLDVKYQEIDVLDQVFGEILPQITCFAISDHESQEPQPALVQGLHRFSRLAHLSVSQTRTDNLVSNLFTFTDPSLSLRLKSVYLPAEMILIEPDLGGRLIDIAKGRRANFEIARIVLYGSKEEIGKKMVLSELLDLEWRPGEKPPFADFDGR
ncbi:hypothetical protein JCM16303_004045 [Sporobolomyces ruberrimus]